METNSRKEQEALIMRHLAAENAHRLDETLATLHPECVFEDVAMGRSFHGHAGAAEYYRMWWEGLRIVVTPESSDRRMWTDDGAYVAETRFTGVHIGPFLGLAPTGRRIEFRFAVFVPFRDGLMAGERFYYDLDGLLRQLGIERSELAA
ncbi:MAG: ester cyclase [Sulfuritalea sp.]|nr:ester cyclase [Sulfuritalea sp.]